MDTLWIRMAALFGPAWTTSYGARDHDGTWQRALSGLTGVDLARGLKRCVDANRKFPPNASEFRAYCLDTGRTREQGALYGRTDNDQQRRLEAPCAPLPPELQAVIDAHPEWQKGADETSKDYGRRMLKICKALAKRHAATRVNVT